MLREDIERLEVGDWLVPISYDGYESRAVMVTAIEQREVSDDDKAYVTIRVLRDDMLDSIHESARDRRYRMARYTPNWDKTILETLQRYAAFADRFGFDMVPREGCTIDLAATPDWDEEWRKWMLAETAKLQDVVKD